MAFRTFSLDLFDRSKHVVESCAVIPHNGTASASARPLTSGRNMRSIATSTRMPVALWTSINSPPRSVSVRPGSKSTSKSMSLAAVDVPLAVEPNTRTFRAP